MIGLPLPKFQFQYGAIGGDQLFIIYRYERTFQFQYGAIGGDVLKIKLCYKKLFQFQYGAIGGVVLNSIRKLIKLVSIPVWCDWWSFDDSKKIIQRQLISFCKGSIFL